MQFSVKNVWFPTEIWRNVYYYRSSKLLRHCLTCTTVYTLLHCMLNSHNFSLQFHKAKQLNIIGNGWANQTRNYLYFIISLIYGCFDKILLCFLEGKVGKHCIHQNKQLLTLILMKNIFWNYSQQTSWHFLFSYLFIYRYDEYHYVKTAWCFSLIFTDVVIYSTSVEKIDEIQTSQQHILNICRLCLCLLPLELVKIDAQILKQTNYTCPIYQFSSHYKSNIPTDPIIDVYVRYRILWLACLAERVHWNYFKCLLWRIYII